MRVSRVLDLLKVQDCDTFRIGSAMRIPSALLQTYPLSPPTGPSLAERFSRSTCSIVSPFDVNPRRAKCLINLHPILGPQRWTRTFCQRLSGFRRTGMSSPEPSAPAKPPSLINWPIEGSRLFQRSGDNAVPRLLQKYYGTVEILDVVFQLRKKRTTDLWR